MSKKLLLSLASVGVLSAATFVAYQGNIGGLRSDSLSTTSNMRTESHGCALYVPNDGGYFDLRGNYLSRDNQADVDQKDILIYHTTENGEYQQFTIPFCTEADIAEVGYIDGDTGRFIREEKIPDVLPSSDIPATTTPTTPPVKQLSQLEILLNAWNNAKTTLANLETELKTLTDSKKALTDRKTVLEKKTGTESITVVTARLAAIEKELTAQLTTLTKNTKLKSVDEYEPAVAQALADAEAITKEMAPFQIQLTTLTNRDLKALTVDLSKLKTDLAALTKIKPQTTQTKTDLANKNKEITAKNLEITNKNKEITAKKAEIAKIQTRKTAAQTKYTTLKSYEIKYIYTFRTKTSALNKEKAELTPKLARLTAELADIKTKLGDRLPALPELVAKQKITVTETQTAYTAYLATLPTGGGTGGTSQECDTNTGENCPNNDMTAKQLECAKNGSTYWNNDTNTCEEIITRDGEEACREPDNGPEELPQGSTCCIGSYSKDFEEKVISDKFMAMSCDSSAVVSETDIASLDSACPADTSRLNIISLRHSCSAFKNRASTEIIQYLRRLKNLDSASYMDLGCNPFRNIPSEPGRLVLDELIALNRPATVVIGGNQNYGLVQQGASFGQLFGNGVVYMYQINTSFGSVCIDGYKKYDKKVSGSVYEEPGPCPAQGSVCYFNGIDDGVKMYCKEGGKTKTIKCEQSDDFIESLILKYFDNGAEGSLGEYNIYPL